MTETNPNEIKEIAKKEIKVTILSCLKTSALILLGLSGLYFLYKAVTYPLIKEVLFNILTIGHSPERGLIAFSVVAALFLVSICIFMKIVQKTDKDIPKEEKDYYFNFLGKLTIWIVILVAIGFTIMGARSQLQEDLEKERVAQAYKAEQEKAQAELDRVKQNLSLKAIAETSAIFGGAEGMCETWEVDVNGEKSIYMLEITKVGMLFVVPWEFNNNLGNTCFHGYSVSSKYNEKSTEYIKKAILQKSRLTKSSPKE